MVLETRNFEGSMLKLRVRPEVRISINLNGVEVVAIQTHGECRGFALM